MKRPVRLALSGAALAFCLTAFALPAFATGTETPDVSGSYHPTRAEALEDLSPADFREPDVTINPTTLAINNLYDDKGNLIPATLSTDGHFFIIPTTTGFLYLATGR